MTRVLITGARAPVALDMARAFRAAGCAVALADSVWPFAAAFSRPRFPIHRLPPPRFAFGAFRTRLRELMADIDLLVPTCEEVFWLAAAAARDGWTARLFAPSLEVLRSLHSKADFAALAHAAGVDAPATLTLAAATDLAGLAWPDLVAKPEFGRFGTRTLIAPQPAALRAIQPTPEHRWVAQERIEGDEFCTFSIVRDRRLIACAVYRPVLRHKRSASYAFEAVDRPEITAMAAQIAARIEGAGQLSFDVIVTPQGRVAPLECNPRSVSGLHLFGAAPGLSYAILEGRPLASPPPGTIRYLSPAMALLGLPLAVATGSPRRLLQIWRGGQDCLTRPADRLPAAGALLDAARFALLGVSGRHTAAGQSTDDIEWNGEPIA